MANAYTATADVAGFIPNYYSKVFLERLTPGPIMMDYCIKKPLPGNSGKVAYFPRMVNSSTTVSAYKLAEGTVISTEKIDDAQVSATIEQFGNSKALWDLTEMTAINGTVEETVKELADQAKNILDKRILQEAYGTSATPSQYAFSVAAYNTVGGAEVQASAFQTYVGTVEFRMKASTVRNAVRRLKALNVAPLDDGFYALIAHSDSVMRLQADTEWQTAYQYTDPENIRKGVAGTYAGAKVQIDNNIFTSAVGSAGATVYFSLLLGRGAVGVTELEGGVKTYTTAGGASKADPIDQLTYELALRVIASKNYLLNSVKLLMGQYRANLKGWCNDYEFTRKKGCVNRNDTWRWMFNKTISPSISNYCPLY